MEGADNAKELDFRFSGSCHYIPEEKKLCDLSPGEVTLSSELPDGSIRAVQGSFVNLSASIHLGPRPINRIPKCYRHG